MAKKIFVAATGKNCGKSTICLSLLYRAARKYPRIGFIKPIGPKLIEFNNFHVDKDAVLMAQVFGLEEHIHQMNPVPVFSDTTRQVLDGQIGPDFFAEKMIEACRYFEKECDFLVIEGAGHAGVGSVLGYNNAEVAKLLDAPVMMVTDGGIGRAIDAVSMNLSVFQLAGAPVRMLVANKLIADKRELTMHYLKKAFAGRDIHIQGGFNFSPILANPTLHRISRLLGAPLKGNLEEQHRIVHHVQLGAASAQRVADLLDESSLLLVNSTRDELMVMLASLYHLPEYRHKIAGMIIPGHAPVSPITARIVDDSNIPYMRTHLTNSEAFTRIQNDVSKITAQDQEKIDLVGHLAEVELDFDTVDKLFD
ncbi:AAA family ATPase [uncultured Desulfuromonas sp.]|uniref:AAA family ATPase n=1 Tax=uncultured Desulfuromonas sp. TaxID=181013 RepID=UPI002AAC4906|nr:AAA family ATPase [uncultured Desulfuromonas sp.]